MQPSDVDWLVHGQDHRGGGARQAHVYSIDRQLQIVGNQGPCQTFPEGGVDRPRSRRHAPRLVATNRHFAGTRACVTTSAWLGGLLLETNAWSGDAARPMVGLDTSYCDEVRDFLTGIGFTETLVVRNQDDLNVVEHAELRWRVNGAVMLGSTRPDNPMEKTAGHAACYLVAPTDSDVDTTYSKALDIGARTVEPPADRPFGGSMATVSDHEGNLWSFGSYTGVQPPQGGEA